MFNVNLLGERIREVRGKKSQDVFATELGISRGALSFYENGERKPDAEIIYKICELCNVSSDYLLGFTDSPTTDLALNAFCEYTGLNENSVEYLHYADPFLDHRNDNGERECLKVFNSLIDDEYFFAMVYTLMELENHSTELVEFESCHQKPFNLEDLMEHIKLEEKCDLGRYNIIKISERISNLYDKREQVQDNGKHTPPKE